jgi:hypothetical protein
MELYNDIIYLKGIANLNKTETSNYDELTGRTKQFLWILGGIFYCNFLEKLFLQSKFTLFSKIQKKILAGKNLLCIGTRP